MFVHSVLIPSLALFLSLISVTQISSVSHSILGRTTLIAFQKSSKDTNIPPVFPWPWSDTMSHPRPNSIILIISSIPLLLLTT